MRPIHRRIGRIGVDRIERDFVFLDVGIVQRLVIVQVAGDLDPRRQPFGEQMLVAEIRFVFLERARLNEGAEVVELLRPLVGQLDDEKDHAAEDRDPHVQLVARRTAASSAKPTPAPP